MKCYFFFLKDFFESKESVMISSLGLYLGLWVFCLMDFYIVFLVVFFFISYEVLYEFYR